jgi:cytochrome b6-f complex iron-sulfur subunit
MDRKKFLEQIGYGGAAIFLGGCLGGCSKGNSTDPVLTTGATDLTIDLTNPAFAALKSIGGFVITEGVIISKTASGGYIAFQSSCTHNSYPIEFQLNNNRFYCSGHGATFNLNGVVTNGPAIKPLKPYNIQLTGNSLRVLG